MYESKASRELRWQARTFGEALVHVTVDADVAALADGRAGRLVRIDHCAAPPPIKI